jgi:AcrR family transcriptional regulator
MRQIADSAGTSIGNLYFYFASKDELLGTLFRETRLTIWGWVDDVSKRFPPGPLRIAIALCANFLRLSQSDSDLMRIYILRGASHTLTRQVVSEHEAHWRQLWTENFPDYPRDQVDLAVCSTMGASRRAIDETIWGTLPGDPMNTALFLVRWTLRAAGVSDAEIENAVGSAKEVIAEFPANTGVTPDH